MTEIHLTSISGVLATPEEAKRVEAEQIRTVMSGNLAGAGLMIFGAFLVAVTTWMSEGRVSIVPWLWWVLQAAGLTGVMLTCRRFNKGSFDADEAIRRRYQPMAFIAFCAVVWGSASWVMLPAKNPATDSFLIVASALVFAMSGASQAIYRPFLLAFLLPATTGFAAGLFVIGDFIHSVLGIAFVLLAIFMLTVCSTQERAVTLAIVLRYRTQQLLEEKTEQQALTDRARKEAEQAREEAEQANQAKTTFLAAASHDLRQPMHALMQYYGHLNRRNQDPSLAETVDRIGKSLDAIQDLLDSILEVSKLMMGAVKPAISSFAVSDVLERLDVQLRALAEEKGLELRVEQDSSVVRTDEVLLERVLRNLVLNAIRYTSYGRVLVRCGRRGGYLSIQVWDTGIGIAKENMEKIFEEFYQVGNKARDSRKGLGLGLSLVRQLCSLLGLTLRLRSTPGVGTAFLVGVRLSTERDAPALKNIPRGKADYVRGSFVVVIDDNESSLAATAASLEEFGCSVLAAASGPEAIERLQGQELMPHLIISDYRLGEGESGIDAIRMVIDNQQALFGEELCISALVVSGDTAPNELRRVHEAGYVMLHKPVTLDLLYVAINDKLERLAVQGLG